MGKLICLVFFTLGGLLGYAAGSRSARGPMSSLLPAVSAFAPAAAAAESIAPGMQPASKAPRPETNPSQPVEVSEPPKVEEDMHTGSHTDIREILDCLGTQGSKCQEWRGAAQGRIGELLNGDPEALAVVLTALRDGTYELTSDLFEALEDRREGLIEETALAMASGGTTSTIRYRGFLLLENLTVLRPETVTALLAMVGSESDPDVPLKAIQVLPKTVSSSEERRLVVRALIPLLSSADDAVRSSVAGRFTEWAFSDEEIAPLFDALHDPSADVRASAACAFGRYRGSDSKVIRALMDCVTNEQEEGEVRSSAWNALRDLPMDSETWLLWKRYTDEFDGD